MSLERFSRFVRPLAAAAALFGSAPQTGCDSTRALHQLQVSDGSTDGSTDANTDANTDGSIGDMQPDMTPYIAVIYKATCRKIFEVNPSAKTIDRVIGGADDGKCQDHDNLYIRDIKPGNGIIVYSNDVEGKHVIRLKVADTMKWDPKQMGVIDPFPDAQSSPWAPTAGQMQNALGRVVTIENHSLPPDFVYSSPTENTVAYQIH